MDDDEDDREFSKGIVFGFLEQAEQTFDKMDASLYRLSGSVAQHTADVLFSVSRDLPELSALGHFLKGSSATLGFVKVKDQCERIQHFGAKKDETGTGDIQDEDYCLRMISEALTEAKKTFKEVAALMRQYYAES
jgi:osomolarity two-component system, phosphorelay intermediate protein YPD1